MPLEVGHNKGGLHNRLTRQIELVTFTLGECEQLVRASGIEMSRKQMIECYMVMGGVPYYWSFLRKGLGIAQNVDATFFAKGAPLASEFDHLFSSLFRHPKDYLSNQIINLCEMKYASDEFALTRASEESLRWKIDDLLRVTGTRSSVHVTLVTTYGLRVNAHSDIVQSVVTADDLFA